MPSTQSYTILMNVQECTFILRKGMGKDHQNDLNNTECLEALLILEDRTWTVVRTCAQECSLLSVNFAFCSL